MSTWKFPVEPWLILKVFVDLERNEEVNVFNFYEKHWLVEISDIIAEPSVTGAFMLNFYFMINFKFSYGFKAQLDPSFL